MRRAKVRTKTGKVRELYIPTRRERRYLRGLLDELRQVPIHPAAHGFVPGRSPVTAALCHRRKSITYTINVDCKDFFAHVTADKLKGKLPAKRRNVPRVYQDATPRQRAKWPREPNGDRAARIYLSRPPRFARCFPGGAAHQGLPTSPYIANIAAGPMDEAILTAARKIDPRAIYTRYCDDISVSITRRPYAAAVELLGAITQACARSGFPVNKRKSRIMPARSGRREIAGVMVDGDGIYTALRWRRTLRAMRHRWDVDPAQDAVDNRLRGMEEWAKLKPPRPTGDIDARRLWAQCQQIAKEYNLPLIQNAPPPTKTIPRIPLGNFTAPGGREYEMEITPDTRYLLCQSAGDRQRPPNHRRYIANWSSCHNIMDGRATEGTTRTGPVFWALLPGAASALLYDYRTAVIAGVRMRRILARSIIFRLKDGRLLYSRIYPQIADIYSEALEYALRHHDRPKLHRAETIRGEDVEGYVYSDKWTPYAYVDSGGRIIKCRMKSGKHAYKYAL
jgi:hypothetical protein